MLYIMSGVAEIGLYVQSDKTGWIPLWKIQDELNADLLLNAQMWNWRTGETSYALKAHGIVYGKDVGAWIFGFGWNAGATSLTWDSADHMAKYQFYLGCEKLVVNGKTDYYESAGKTYGGKRGRTALGTTADGSIVCFACSDAQPITLDELAQKMIDAGCRYAIMLDGGGSSQMICPDGKVNSARNVQSIFWAKLKPADSQEENSMLVEAKTVGRVNVTLNVRSGPGTGYRIVRNYAPGTVVDIITKSGSWLQTADGWIYAAYVSVSEVPITEEQSLPSADARGCPYKEPTAIILPGANHDGVRWLQWYLNRWLAPQDQIDVDGDYGPSTTVAVKAFQTAFHLTSNGKVDDKMRVLLQKDVDRTVTITPAAAGNNSSLVSVTKISPHRNSPRSHAVDRITVHCVVGQTIAAALGTYFQGSVQASSNYGIGTNGEVGLYVDEGDRSWCSSNQANDDRAITIECASDTVAPYKVNEKVWATLLDLCEDICRRYGKKKLLWFGDKNKTLAYQPADDEMVMTVHRWFANKNCPGDYLYSRHAEIAAEVTRRLNNQEPAQTTQPDDVLKDVPDWAKASVKKLVDCGAIQGDGTGLNLSDDLLRIIVILDRAGVFK